MIEITIFHAQDTNVQSETFSKELLHDISNATQLSILHVSKVTKFSPECVAHEIYQISTLDSTVSKYEFLCLFFPCRRPDLITLYFHEPDYTAHRQGPDANQVRLHLLSACTASSQAF